MKAVLIASDLILDADGNAKMIEMNTNGGIFQEMFDQLDYSGLIQLITDNSINELHLIFSPDSTGPGLILTEDGSNIVLKSMKTVMEDLCNSIGISFYPYLTEENSITVPNIDDAPNKLILRQSYDTTALIDETYCADKKGLQDLIKDEDFSIPTYLNTQDLSINSLNNLKSSTPNIILKSRHPNYDPEVYPKVYSIQTESELEDLKSNLDSNYYIQEFVNSENNLYDNKYGIIRSVDIVYGGDLGILHLGSYTNTSVIENNIWQDSFIEGTLQLDKKSRMKWISKSVNNKQEVEYHVDDETKIIDSLGNQIGISEISVGTQIKTIQFSNFPTDTETTYLPSIVSTVTEMISTLTAETSVVKDIEEQTLEGIFIGIELEDGTYWEDATSSNFYVEDSGSDVTHFKTVNTLIVGDKIVLLNNNDNSIVKKEIINLTILYGSKKIYKIDVEDIDIFLAVLDDTNNLSLIQHNYNCNCCYTQEYCNYGYYCCQNVPSCNCGGGCFIGNAEVNTPSGLKKISDIKIGDIVISYDIKNDMMVERNVDGLFKTEYSGGILTINGIKTNATIGHPFAVKDSEGNILWASYDPSVDKEYHKDIDVIKLKENDHMINLNGEWTTIDTIELEQFNGTVYNIAVENTHNYIVENLLVHNAADKKAFE